MAVSRKLKGMVMAPVQFFWNIEKTG